MGFRFGGGVVLDRFRLQSFFGASDVHFRALGFRLSMPLIIMLTVFLWRGF